jgi:hypothetical protein
MTTTQQLELGFNATASRIHGRRRETRVTRAQWWFARMREAVANATSWQETEAASAEQIFFSGAKHELKA